MENDYIYNLKEKQKDILKEIGNIGAGNAATSFGKFLNREIQMSVPSVEISPITEVPNIIGNPEKKVAGILLVLEGDLNGKILLIFTKQSLNYLFNIIFDKEINSDEIADIEISALKEIGNIMSGSYLSALNQMTDLNLKHTVPAFSYDMVGAILSSIMITLENSSEYSLLIKTILSDKNNKIENYFFLIPEKGALDMIFKALEFDEND